MTERKWIPVRRTGSGHEVFLLQNLKGAWREGLWDFPLPDPRGVMAGVLLKEFKIKYVVTNHKVERIHQVFEIESRTRLRFSEGKWFSMRDLPGIPAPVKKAISVIEAALTDG